MSSSPDTAGAAPLVARRPAAGDLPGLKRARHAAFGGPVVHEVPESAEEFARLCPLERQVAVYDGARIVGGCRSYEFQLSVPGGSMVPVGGLAAVGILPTDTGRGGLPAMMRAHLEQSLELGDIASVLMSSESGLYGRYGYGQATDFSEWRTNTAAVRLRSDVPEPQGTIRIITDLDDAAQLLAEVHDKAISQCAGGLSRSADWWHLILRNKKRDWIGGGEQFVAVRRDVDGNLDGYCLWTVEEDESLSDTTSGHGRVRDAVRVAELVGVTAEAETHLFLFLQSIPLTKTMIWVQGPLDPVARHQLADPRQLWQHARIDMLWLRPLDIAALLTTRAWNGSGRVVLDVHDAFMPEVGGTFVLDVTNGSAEVSRTSDAADVSLTAADLGAMYLGGMAPHELRRAGRIMGTDSATHTLSHLMLTTRPPFTLTKF